jgi:hypothetical protein
VPSIRQDQATRAPARVACQVEARGHRGEGYPRACTSALGGKEPNLRAAPDGVPGGSGATVQAVSRSVPAYWRGGPSDPMLGIFRGELSGAAGDANVVASGSRLAHRDGKRHDRQPGACNQNEQHSTEAVRRLRSLVEGLHQAGSWLASRILPTSGCTDQNNGRPQCDRGLVPLSEVQPRHGRWPCLGSLYVDHNSACPQWSAIAGDFPR